MAFYCDSCDTKVRGIRHKCTACHDFDYCSRCFQDATLIHPGHEFVSFQVTAPEASPESELYGPDVGGDAGSQTSRNCTNCEPITLSLPLMHMAHREHQERTSQKVKEKLIEGIDDDAISEDAELNARLAEALYQRIGDDCPLDFDHFKTLPFAKMAKYLEAKHGLSTTGGHDIADFESQPSENTPTIEDLHGLWSLKGVPQSARIYDPGSDEQQIKDPTVLGAKFVRAILGDDFPITKIESADAEPEKPGIRLRKPPGPLLFPWHTRLSKLIEATQRGCVFCSFFLNRVFATKLTICGVDLFGTLGIDAWLTKGRAEQSQERERAVASCMARLTKLKYDRFTIAVTPVCSLKGLRSPDFNRLNFTLLRAADDQQVLQEIFCYTSLTIGERHGAIPLSFEVNVYTTEDDPAASVLTSRTPNARPGSDKSLALVKEWASYCEKNHSHTCILSPGFRSDLPRRVIDVGDGQFLRLHVTCPGEQDRYVALSYCWGGSQAFQTTASSMTEMQRGFSISKLPKTMQDAIHVTKSLGVRYIWIDVLCIMQDVPSDKAYEFSQMANIYKGAHVTICASRAESVDEGFLEDTADESTGLWNGLIPLAYRVPDSTATTTQEAFSLPNCQMGTIWLHDENQSWRESFMYPTTRRGWCLQEQLLSPRFLSYGRWPTWRCRRSTFTDGGYYFSNSSMRDATDTLESRLADLLFSTPQSSNFSPGLDIFRTTQLYQAWYALLHDYSKRQIGCAGDRLPAVAGIAAEVARLTGCKYLAGLWGENALYDLMWFTRVREWCHRPSEWRAPSWSWASVESTILYGRITPDSKPLAAVRACTVTLKDSISPFGEVTGGTMEVEGPFARLRSQDVNALLEEQSLFLEPQGDYVKGDWTQALLKHVQDTRVANVYDSTKGDFEKNPSVEGPVYGLITFSRDANTEKSAENVEEVCYSGIFLRDTGDSSGCFERLGSFINETKPWLDQEKQPWEVKSIVIV